MAANVTLGSGTGEPLRGNRLPSPGQAPGQTPGQTQGQTPGFALISISAPAGLASVRVAHRHILLPVDWDGSEHIPPDPIIRNGGFSAEIMGISSNPESGRFELRLAYPLVAGAASGPLRPPEPGASALPAPEAAVPDLIVSAVDRLGNSTGEGRLMIENMDGPPQPLLLFTSYSGPGGAAVLGHEEGFSTHGFLTPDHGQGGGFSGQEHDVSLSVRYTSRFAGSAPGGPAPASPRPPGDEAAKPHPHDAGLEHPPACPTVDCSAGYRELTEDLRVVFDQAGKAVCRTRLGFLAFTRDPAGGIFYGYLGMLGRAGDAELIMFLLSDAASGTIRASNLLSVRWKDDPPGFAGDAACDLPGHGGGSGLAGPEGPGASGGPMTGPDQTDLNQSGARAGPGAEEPHGPLSGQRDEEEPPDHGSADFPDPADLPPPPGSEWRASDYLDQGKILKGFTFGEDTLQLGDLIAAGTQPAEGTDVLLAEVARGRLGITVNSPLCMTIKATGQAGEMHNIHIELENAPVKEQDGEAGQRAGNPDEDESRGPGQTLLHSGQ